LYELIRKAVNKTKSKLFEFQNSIFRKMLNLEFPQKNFFTSVFLGNDYSGYWFPQEMLKDCGTIWGVGLGHDSSFELALTERGYKLYGFEPELECYQMSTKQFENTNALIENYGLWDRTGRFPYAGENVSIVNIFRLPQVEEVELDIRSLWEIAIEKELHSHKPPRILKMNIEGAEREILLRLMREPLDFEVVIFQAEFMFHVGFRRIAEKIKAYQELRLVLRNLQNNNWVIENFSRHQYTLIKHPCGN
jgi:FkbM family methyltransferase